MVAPSRESLIRFRYAKTLVLLVLNGFGLVLLCSRPGVGHGAIATVTRTFSVEAHYVSGEPMAMAQVVVYSPENPDEPWTTGQTDAAGTFEFNPDTDGNWDVVIRQAGHGTTVNVPVETPILTQIEANTSHQSRSQSVAAPTAALVSSSEPLTHPLQRWASAGAALWGLFGTVLFFSRGKQS